MAKDRLDRALEELDGLINWERKDRSGGMERTLDPILALLERLGDPQEAWNGVLVAGTKGKGSVSALIAAGMGRAGLSVGIYSSPHVERVTERVRVDGAEVERDELGAALEQALAARATGIEAGDASGEATWFDLMTAASFLIFRNKGVDWAVVEVGIGGRLDSTRAVEAPVSVVTNVELEHMSTLGSTRAAIAGEKGAVISAGGTLVTGVQSEDSEPFLVLEELAEAADGELVSVPQKGTMAERNLAIAETVLNVLGGMSAEYPECEGLWRSCLDEEAVQSAGLPGRMERFKVNGVPVILDSGHVAASAKLVLDELERDPDLGRKPKLIVALGGEKDARSVMEAFSGRIARCMCTTAPEGRLLGEQDLAQAADDADLDPEAWNDPREALGEALADAEDGGGWILVFGSFYLSAVLRDELVAAASPDSDPLER
jgi:dihydrofolate synthase / folylpolyglutamate synthase